MTHKRQCDILTEKRLEYAIVDNARTRRMKKGDHFSKPETRRRQEGQQKCVQVFVA